MRIPLLPMLLLLFVGAVTPCSAATKVQSRGSQYLIDKVPAWVAKLPGPTSPLPETSAAGATQILLSDTQVNLLGPKPVSYFHVKRVARERAGLEQVSNLKIAFNPRYETLTLHELAVFRDGRRIDRLKTARIDLAQRERQLEDGIYDEDVEAIIALNDIRIGDTVEYAYSIAGENPVFEGKYSRLFSLNRDQPIAWLSVRIQYPASRKLRHLLYRSDLPVSESVEGAVKTLSLEAGGLTPVRIEQSTPSWFSPFPWLQVSEYGSWEDVNAWARTLYAVPRDLSPEIEAVLERLKGEAKTPEQLVIKTLAWVQKEIRYYSVAVGTSSHRPTHPNQTVRQRFGDCKDKSVLLSAMLQRLGIAAEPALVSGVVRRSLDDLLPSPQFFDHAIVRVRLGDQAYWLDGTLSYQGSALATLGFVPYGKALLAASSSRELSDVVEPPESRNGMEVAENFKVGKYGAPVALLVEEKYFGAFAEHFRRRVAAEGINRFIEAQHADYGKDFPNIALGGVQGVDDDPARNVVTLRQSFTVPQLYTYEEGRARMHSTYARSVVPWLRFPGTPDRKSPLELSFPASFEHRLVIDLPNKIPGPPPAPANWQDRHLAVSSQIKLDGNRLSFIYGARMLQDHVAAADFPDFSARFKQNAWPLLFSTLQVPLVDNVQLRNRLARDLDKTGLGFRNPDLADDYLRKFLHDYALADETIRSGLIAGPLLAAAYRDRAEAASSLGRREEALADIGRSIDLEANDSAQVLKAEIQLYSGRYQDALNTLRAVPREGDKANTLVDAGMAHFYLGNYPEAQRNFAKAAELAEGEELSHVLIWLAVSAKRAGNEPASVLRRYRNRLGDAWPAQAIPFLLDESDEDKLLAAARQDEKEARARLCEAYFYLGQKALLDGDVADARQWFGKSIDTKVIMYREHALSQHELRRLAQH